MRYKKEMNFTQDYESETVCDRTVIVKASPGVGYYTSISVAAPVSFPFPAESF